MSKSPSVYSSSTSATINQYNLTKICLASNLNLADFLNPILGYNESLNLNSLNSSASSFALNPNLEAYFMHTIGSSFYNGSAPYSLMLTTSEIKELSQIIKKLFVKNVITQINRHLNEFIAIQQVFDLYELKLKKKLR